MQMMSGESLVSFNEGKYKAVSARVSAKQASSLLPSRQDSQRVFPGTKAHSRGSIAESSGNEGVTLMAIVTAKEAVVTDNEVAFPGGARATGLAKVCRSIEEFGSVLEEQVLDTFIVQRRHLTLLDLTGPLDAWLPALMRSVISRLTFEEKEDHSLFVSAQSLKEGVTFDLLHPTRSPCK